MNQQHSILINFPSLEQTVQHLNSKKSGWVHGFRIFSLCVIGSVAEPAMQKSMSEESHTYHGGQKREQEKKIYAQEDTLKFLHPEMYSF